MTPTSALKSDSPYQKFPHNPRDDWRFEEDGGMHWAPATTIIDQDGSVLHETEFYSLISTIVSQNDVPALEQYLAKAPGVSTPVVEQDFSQDLYKLAVMNGSVNALHTLMTHYLKSLNTTGGPRFDKHDFLMLNVAAASGQLEVVRYLLDKQSSYVDIHARDRSGLTAIAAASYGAYGPFECPIPQGCSFDRNEAIMNLLLDRGADASDLDGYPQHWLDSFRGELPISDTVLTLATRWAGAQLVQRLINGGADVHAKVTHWTDKHIWGCSEPQVSGVTAVLTACQYANINALKVLFDCRGTADATDMACCRDSLGGLPLHWVNRVPIREDVGKISASELQQRVQQIINTMEFLLDKDPTTINVQDNDGNTPLHYASEYYGTNGNQHTAIIKYLCDRGADASIQNKKGQTPLHTLCHRINGGEPLDTDAMAVLLEHGAKVTDIDDAGDTPLHLAAWQLHNLDAVIFLLSQGANAAAKNSKQSTPVHEAANGVIWTVGSDRTARDMIKAQDSVVSMLLEAGGRDLIDEPNAEGKTPRELREDRRALWREWDETVQARRNGTYRPSRGGRGAIRRGAH
ncbi:hypothetical protein ACHAPJ_012050 [Fusarium lateritium]